MYCYHCGCEINENKLEEKSSSFSLAGPDKEIDSDTTVSYVCPRCGHLIHAGCSEEDEKALSRAAHAQIQRGSNNFARGMCSISIGAIALIIALMFYRIAKKPSNQYQLVTTCSEFYVFIVLSVIAVILLAMGITFVVLGITKKMKYTSLLKDLNNKTFIQ